MAAKSYEIYCESNDITYKIYRVYYLSEEHTRPSYWRIDRVSEKSGIIEELPLKLDFKSRILNFLIGIWPLYGIVSNVELKEGCLKLSFFDYLDETPFYPFNLDKHSEWLAKYNSETLRWTLKRLRYL